MDTTNYTCSVNYKSRAFASTNLQKCQEKKIFALLKVLADIPPISLETGFHPECGS